MPTIRKALPGDIPAVAEIYTAAVDREEAGPRFAHWYRGVYPTEDLARASLAEGTLFVLEEVGRVVASVRIDGQQTPAYAECPWQYAAADEEVMVLHTLVVHPDCSGRGYGRALVRYYEQYALDHGRRFLRLDTNVDNAPARHLYGILGYREAGVIHCVLNQVRQVSLVCLEKKL